VTGLFSTIFSDRTVFNYFLTGLFSNVLFSPIFFGHAAVWAWLFSGHAAVWAWLGLYVSVWDSDGDAVAMATYERTTDSRFIGVDLDAPDRPVPLCFSDSIRSTGS
jgi:hypothetical protein